MKIAIASFTEAGRRLAERLAFPLGLEGHDIAHTPFRGGGISLGEWTATQFQRCGGLLFIGATGIAVRAIGPLLRSKTTDPAVLSLDEQGRFVIPLVSGHIGGANRLAKRLAEITGGQAVISTATDLNGLFAVDEWAARQNLSVENPENIKVVSAKLLSGGTIRLYSKYSIEGSPPAGIQLTDMPGKADVIITDGAVDGEQSLHLIPRCNVMGIGCRKGIPEAVICSAADRALGQYQIHSLSVRKVCTIDRKAAEPGLIAFCKSRELPLEAFPPEALEQVAGTFSASAFVRETVGVDNVCERSAVLGANGGPLLIPKQAWDGVTVALAAGPVCLKFDHE